MDQSIRQQIVDEEQLRLLTLFYYISAGITALFACFPFIHLIMGIIMIVISCCCKVENGDAPLAVIGLVFIGFALVFILAGWTIAVLKFLVARSIRNRRNYTFCLVVAGISCLSIPYGTILGVMTFIVLLKGSVKTMFSQHVEENFMRG